MRRVKSVYNGNMWQSDYNFASSIRNKNERKLTQNLLSNFETIKQIKKMKKLFYTLAFALVATLSISACSDEEIRPIDGPSDDPCQFGGPGCK